MPRTPPPPAAPRRLPPDWYARSRLKLRHLQLLTAMDDLRNLNRAAQSLGLTQPAASKLLAEIEQIVGVPLFERRPRGVEPNLQGEVLLRRARTVLVALEQAGEELNSLRSGAGGTVAVGAVTGPAVDGIARAVELAQQRSPALRISVEVETSAPLVERLRAGRLDLVLARIPQGASAAGLEYREVGEEPLCFLAGEGHPLLAGPPPGLPALLGYPWVLEPPGSLLRQAVETMVARHGLSLPGRVLNTASTLLALSVLARGEAVCVVSEPVAALFDGAGRVRRLPPPPEEPHLAVPPFGLIRLKDRPLSPAAQGFFELLETVLFPA